MPKLGQTSDEVKLIRWLVKEGQEIVTGQPLCEVETEKVTMEVESFTEGVVLKLMVKQEDYVNTGDIIMLLEESNREKRKTNN